MEHVYRYQSLNNTYATIVFPESAGRRLRRQQLAVLLSLRCQRIYRSWTYIHAPYSTTQKSPEGQTTTAIPSLRMAGPYPLLSTCTGPIGSDQGGTAREWPTIPHASVQELCSFGYLTLSIMVQQAIYVYGKGSFVLASLPVANTNHTQPVMAYLPCQDDYMGLDDYGVDSGLPRKTAPKGFGIHPCSLAEANI